MLNSTIREIRKQELPFLREMLYEAIFVEEGQPKVPRSIIDEDHLAKYITDFGTRNHDFCLVAVVENQLVGACWGRLFSEENKGYGFINSETPELSIAIKEEFRQQGIGSRLIRKLILHYQHLNIQFISLSVDKKNEAHQLYRKLGFKTFSETEKSILMHLNIQESRLS